MRRVVTARLGEEYGVREKLHGEVSDVMRIARIGFVANDIDSDPKRDRAGAAVRKLSFEARFARTIQDVYLTADYIVFNNNSLFIDGSIFTIDIREKSQAMAIGNDLNGRLNEIALDYTKTISIDGTTILGSNEGCLTWGHWVVHNLPRVVAVAQLHPDANVIVPASYFGTRPSYGELLLLSGIARERIITTRAHELYRFEKLVIPDYFYKQNSIHPAAISLLSQIPQMVGTGGEHTPENVLIKRATSGKRDVANSSEFETLMSSFDFHVCELGSQPFSDQVRVWQRAKRIASVLGSDLTNIVFGPERLSVVAFTPNRFGDDFFFDLAAAKGYSWSELFCGRITRNTTSIINSSFVVDLDSAKELISKLLENDL